MAYASIIVDISHEAIDRVFEYEIPEPIADLISVGTLVEFPFGNSNKVRTGYVIDIHEEPDFDPEKIKEICGVPGKGLAIEGNLIRLAAWMRKSYGGTMISALKTVMPVKERVRKQETKTETPEMELEKPPVLSLTDKQQSLVDEFCRDFSNEDYKTYLLRGITGSGKTEVYIGCIKQVIAAGGQAILLIPEIGLTYQTIARLKQHFQDRVAFINSRQSKGEKFRVFERAKAGELDVVVGPRSALFTTCKNLKLIVMDEEHDGAYKSDQTPKYHTREVARKRAELEGASVILGSATPTMESYTQAKKGAYVLWELDSRAGDGELSDVTLVDMRDELHMGNRSILSNKLSEMIADRLSKKQQVMLFINRRGYHSFVSCRECGESIKCPRCDVTLTLHANGTLMCHYCGHTERSPQSCPKCKSKLIGGFGTGTEKVEQEIKKFFPAAKTLRMDKDTTTKKGDHARILNAFMNKKADILIGTQMIVKGHDFANVTLVGIILADLSLFANDFRSSERTFDLLVQAAGRAGRGELPGDVLIQTYQPDHYAIAAAAKQDYEGFYEMEMAYRRLLRYPPAYQMFVTLLVSEDYARVKEASEALAASLKEACEGEKTTMVIGPGDATIGRINNLYRRVIYVKCESEERMEELREIADAYEAENVALQVDVNPLLSY